MFNNIFSSNVLYDDKTVTKPKCPWSTVYTNLKRKIARPDHLALGNEEIKFILDGQNCDISICSYINNQYDTMIKKGSEKI